jgi:hypothetical protein
MSLDAATQLVAHDPIVMEMSSSVIEEAAREGMLRMIADVIEGVDVDRHRAAFGDYLIERILAAGERLKEKTFTD